MPFTNYRYAPAWLAAKVVERQAALMANRGMSDLLGFGAAVVLGRLAKDQRRYMDYGPYWWALKELLNARGANLGEQSDPLVSQVYRGGSDVETLVAADEFRADYLRSQAIGTCQFVLDGNTGEQWVLSDPDMTVPGMSADGVFGRD